VGNAKVKPRDSQGSEPWRPSEPHQKGTGRILWEMPEEYLQTLSITFWDSSRDTLRNYQKGLDIAGLFSRRVSRFVIGWNEDEKSTRKNCQPIGNNGSGLAGCCQTIAVYSPSKRGSCLKIKYDKKQQEFRKRLKFFS
jgi:hypothetical protein